MSALSQVTARDAIRVATKLGFVFRRQKGSHAVYKRESDKRRVVIVMHGSRTYPIGTVRAMLRDMDITPEEFERLR